MKLVDHALPDVRTAAPPVLLLHCSASSGRQWDRLAGAFGGGFHPVAPDLYGYGDTEPWPGPGALSLAAEAALADAALPVGADGVHVVGHSYGGAVALRFAVEQPWRVKSLALIEPVAFHTLREGGAGDRRLLDSVHRVAASVARGVLTGDYQGAMGRFVDYWSGDGAWHHTKPETRHRLSRHAPKVVLDFHAAVNERATLETYCRCFEFPVAILCGERSPEPTRRIAALLSERIPHASLSTVPGAGHMLPLTHPEQVNEAIAAHIRNARIGDGRRAA